MTGLALCKPIGANTNCYGITIVVALPGSEDSMAQPFPLCPGSYILPTLFCEDP